MGNSLGRGVTGLSDMLIHYMNQKPEENHENPKTG
jgi:hypothetical protein